MQVVKTGGGCKKRVIVRWRMAIIVLARIGLTNISWMSFYSAGDWKNAESTPRWDERGTRAMMSQNYYVHIHTEKWIKIGDEISSGKYTPMCIILNSLLFISITMLFGHGIMLVGHVVADIRKGRNGSENNMNNCFTLAAKVGKGMLVTLFGICTMYKPNNVYAIACVRVRVCVCEMYGWVYD